ncbi:hypothetical protein HYW82_02830, partial [Candidatus Peregrinibacteria bacterium]|nr:hypothetical protein [Candidatus Peregrinibacteria bacterium]
EREYWMQILPIMSEEQIVKLKDILNNEKEQLKQLGGEYKGFKPISAPPIDEKSRKERISNIQQKEQSQEEKEEAEEEKLLKKMQEL